MFPWQEREKLFWDVVAELQRKRKAERRALEEKLGDSKRTGLLTQDRPGETKRSRTK